MGFALQLAQDLVEVEAGGNSPVTVTITNLGDAVDRFELEIEGLDQEWKAVPVPTFSVDPKETRSERAFFKPPRVSESGAGNYPFVVKVRSLETGEQKTVQGVLRLKPYHYLTMEIDPRKGLYSWSTHRNSFQVRLVNLGNTDHTLQLVGSDPEDACTYEFEQEQVSIAPGQQKDVMVEVRPVNSPLLAGSKLIGFSVHGRSIDVPSVSASGQAQLERRSLLSPANLTVVIIFLLICSAWFLMKPKPPAVDVTVTTLEGLPGDKVNVSWLAHDADRVELSTVDAEGQRTTIYQGNTLESSVPIVLGGAGKEVIYAQAFKGNNKSPDETKATITVDTPAAKVTPTIVSFSPNQQRVKVPGDIVFSWKTKDATKVALAPDIPDLPVDLDSQTVHFDSPGEKDYYLIAWSKDGVPVQSQKFHIVAYEVSDAAISTFTAVPSTVAPGATVTLTWTTTNATQVVLKYKGNKLTSQPTSGVMTIPVTQNTVFTLVAFDAQNRPTTSKVSVKVQEVPPPTPTTSGPTDGTTTGQAPPSTTAGSPQTTGDPPGGNDGGGPPQPTTGRR